MSLDDDSGKSDDEDEDGDGKADEHDGENNSGSKDGKLHDKDDDDDDDNDNAADEDRPTPSDMKLRSGQAKWTPYRVARQLHPELYEEGKQKAIQSGTTNLALHRPSERYMWEQLTEEQQEECTQKAKDWNKGKGISPALQQR